MKRFVGLFLPAVLVSIFVAVFALACGLASERPEAGKTTAPVATPSLGSSWDELVKAARKEGTVTIYAVEMAPTAVTSLREAFKEKFGINLEFVSGRPPEVIAKLNAERSAGLYLADIGHLGDTASVMDVRPLGITVPLSDLLVLQEVKDPKKWIGDRLPFLDKDKHVLMFMAIAMPPGVSSTDLVKEGDLSSYLDILKPGWKGKIVLSDPSVAGPSPNALAVLVNAFGKERASEIFGQLAAQDPVMTKDQRLLMEWVARGRYPIGLGASMALFADFKKASAPVRILSLREPRSISGGAGSLMVFSKNPHPKATQVYVNWLLSKEGASIWSKAMGYPSTRLDIDTANLDPNTVPRATDIFPDEDHMRLRIEIRQNASKFFK